MVVCKGGVGANKDIIFQPDAIPKLDPALYGDPVPYDNIILDKHMVADVTIRANLCPWKNVDKSPDPRSWANVIGFNNRIRVLEEWVHN
jgi:hypothetical protein